MSEMYNKTLLFSGTGVSSCNLSEPVQNFEYMQVALSPNERCIVPSNSSISIGKLVGGQAWYNTDSYLDWQYQYSVSNSGKTLAFNNFQMLMQNASAAPRLFGSAGNRTSNMKHIVAVWGVNRILGTPASAPGVPCTGDGWRAYNETLLASASANSSSLSLTEPASAFNRIRVTVGIVTESRNSFEYNAPLHDNDKLTVKSYWGNNASTNALVLSRYQWTDGTMTLSSLGGKAFQLWWNSANPWSASGQTANANWIWRPIYAVYGINRK